MLFHLLSILVISVGLQMIYSFVSSFFLQGFETRGTDIRKKVSTLDNICTHVGDQGYSYSPNVSLLSSDGLIQKKNGITSAAHQTSVAECRGSNGNECDFYWSVMGRYQEFTLWQ